MFECLRCVAGQMLRLRGFSLILAFDAVGDDMDYMMSYIFWNLWLRAFLWSVFGVSSLDCCAFSELLRELCSLRKFSWAVLMMLRGLQACFGTVAEIQNCKILFTLDSLSSALWETSQAWDAGSKLPNIRVDSVQRVYGLSSPQYNTQALQSRGCQRGGFVPNALRRLWDSSSSWLRPEHLRARNRF